MSQVFFFFAFLFFGGRKCFNFGMDPSRRRATSPREFGDSSDNAGAIETSSRFHTSKERRNPRLGGGDGGGEQEEASEIDLEIYLSTAASSRQREKKKKSIGPSNPLSARPLVQLGSDPKSACA